MRPRSGSVVSRDRSRRFREQRTNERAHGGNEIGGHQSDSCALFDVGAARRACRIAACWITSLAVESAKEAAFATLVERHGPMVLPSLGVCWPTGIMAEDAFQVTFLLLARRARSIHDPDAPCGLAPIR